MKYFSFYKENIFFEWAENGSVTDVRNNLKIYMKN